MTSQQLFLHRRSLTATEWFCVRCGEPPRHPGGLCDRCIAAGPHVERNPVRTTSTAADRAG